MPARALLLDRDGVVNRDTGYLHTLAELELLPGILELARLAAECQARIYVVTNQSGIARGYVTRREMQMIHAEIGRRFAAQGAAVQRFLFCPHHPEFDSRCLCRKPQTLMLQRALALSGAAPAKAVMIGDSPRDLRPARQLGIRTIGLNTVENADVVVSSLAECLEPIRQWWSTASS